MAKQILHAERLSVFTDTANLINLGFSIQEGQCLSLGVPNREERRLLLQALMGTVSLTDGILRLSGKSIEEEAPFVRLTYGMSVLLPRTEADELFPDDRAFGQSLMGYRRVFWGQRDLGFPWNGDKKSLRQFRRKNKIYTKEGRKSGLIIYYEPGKTGGGLDEIFRESLMSYREEGGSVLIIDEKFCPERCMNHAGLICEGRMLGIVENNEEDLERLWSMGGVGSDV